MFIVQLTKYDSKFGVQRPTIQHSNIFGIKQVITEYYIIYYFTSFFPLSHDFNASTIFL